jgi:NAD dependent epimerase/dehydratase family enzyme
VPAFAVRLLFGRMGEELLPASRRVEPARMIGSGFSCRHLKLQGALEAMPEHRRTSGRGRIVCE